MLLEGAGITTTFPEDNVALSNKSLHNALLYFSDLVMPRLEDQVQKQSKSQHNYMQRDVHCGLCLWWQEPGNIQMPNSGGRLSPLQNICIITDTITMINYCYLALKKKEVDVAILTWRLVCEIRCEKNKFLLCRE